MSITTAARRIARRLNSRRGMGGKCVFDAADGTGGAWYSENSYPHISDDLVVFFVPDFRITAREIQDRLDA